jgi:hypothetical protein
MDALGDEKCKPAGKGSFARGEGSESINSEHPRVSGKSLKQQRKVSLKRGRENGVLAAEVVRGKTQKPFNSFHFLSSPLRLLRMECAGTQRNWATLWLTALR